MKVCSRCGKKHAYDTECDSTSLSERVKKSSVNITGYVNTSTGNDNNDGLTTGTAFKTIQKAIDILPQVINHTVNVNTASGTYTETVKIQGFGGSGLININGGTDITTALNYVVTSFNISRNGLSVNIYGFTSNGTTDNGFYSNGNRVCAFNYCNDIVNAPSKIGFYSVYSTTTINSCQVSNKSTGIVSFNGEKYSGNKIIKTLDSIIVLDGNIEVFTAKGITDFSLFKLEEGQTFDIPEPTTEEALIKDLATMKINNMKKDVMMTNALQTIASLKVEVMNLKGGNA